MDYWTGKGADTVRMIAFVRRIIQDVGPDTLQQRYCFTMDNLSSHHNLQIATIIFNAGHRIVSWAPYYPVDGPIEYVFNTMQGTLKINNSFIHDGPSLIAEVQIETAVSTKRTNLVVGFLKNKIPIETQRLGRCGERHLLQQLVALGVIDHAYYCLVYLRLDPQPFVDELLRRHPVFLVGVVLIRCCPVPRNLQLVE